MIIKIYLYINLNPISTLCQGKLLVPSRGSCLENLLANMCLQAYHCTTSPFQCKLEQPIMSKNKFPELLRKISLRDWKNSSCLKLTLRKNLVFMRPLMSSYKSTFWRLFLGINLPNHFKWIHESHKLKLLATRVLLPSAVCLSAKAWQVMQHGHNHFFQMS